MWCWAESKRMGNRLMRIRQCIDTGDWYEALKVFDIP
jgi:hypothetical protein